MRVDSPPWKPARVTKTKSSLSNYRSSTNNRSASALARSIGTSADLGRGQVWGGLASRGRMASDLLLPSLNGTRCALLRVMRLWIAAFVCATAAQAADVCDPVRFGGPYAFQLSGMTTIGGTPQPTVSIGRIIFDGSGKISGTSSATFSGLLLGNPVTGTYEMNNDCTLTWKLQDDSGAYQHFSGKVSPDAVRIPFRQTDPGGTSGVMQRTSDNCSSIDL